jgi:hypothetical protein
MSSPHSETGVSSCAIFHRKRNFSTRPPSRLGSPNATLPGSASGKCFYWTWDNIINSSIRFDFRLRGFRFERL